MSNKASVVCVLSALALATNVHEAHAFAPASFASTSSTIARFAEDIKPTEAAFIPVEEETEKKPEIELDTVEMLGRGAAKVCATMRFSETLTDSVSVPNECFVFF